MCCTESVTDSNTATAMSVTSTVYTDSLGESKDFSGSLHISYVDLILSIDDVCFVLPYLTDILYPQDPRCTYL